MTWDMIQFYVILWICIIFVRMLRGCFREDNPEPSLFHLSVVWAVLVAIGFGNPYYWGLLFIAGTLVITLLQTYRVLEKVQIALVLLLVVCIVIATVSVKPDWLAAAIAVFVQGGVLVPLDSKLSREEHQTLITHSGATHVVTEKRFQLEASSVPWATRRSSKALKK